MIERAAQRAQAKRLADDETVQDDAHHQRLFARCGQHLVELIDDHVGELIAGELPPDPAGTVVQLLRIGH